jgi:hypothetical protein
MDNDEGRINLNSHITIEFNDGGMLWQVLSAPDMRSRRGLFYRLKFFLLKKLVSWSRRTLYALEPDQDQLGISWKDIPAVQFAPPYDDENGQ